MLEAGYKAPNWSMSVSHVCRRWREVALAGTHPGLVSFQNVLPCRVRRVTSGARATLVELDASGTALLSRVTPDAAQRLGLAPGAPVIALFKSVGIEVS